MPPPDHYSIPQHHKPAPPPGGLRDACLHAVRDRLASFDLSPYNARTMREDLNKLNSFIEWDAGIYEVPGGFALLLACLGLGGVTAYAVARRRKAIGIRMALGARGHQIQGLVIREGIALIAIGSVLGFAGAWAFARVFAAFNQAMARSFAHSAGVPPLILIAPFVLAGLAILACYLPARRATGIDPMSALREE